MSELLNLTLLLGALKLVGDDYEETKRRRLWGASDYVHSNIVDPALQKTEELIDDKMYDAQKKVVAPLIVAIGIATVVIVYSVRKK